MSPSFRAAFFINALVIFIVAVVLGGCARRGGRDANDNRCDLTEPDCPEGRICENFFDGLARCAVPVAIVGQVVQLVDETPVEGALVQAVDINGAAVGASAATAADGGFSLSVPAVRNEDGVPIEGIYTLRVQAAGYQEFPTAIRPALPLDASSAVASEESWIIENPLTIVGLIALPGDVSLLGSISGHVLVELNSSVLVVAEGGGGGGGAGNNDQAYVGFSDGDGAYTIFNVSAGSFTVTAYAAGVQVQPRAVSVDVGEALTGVDLTGSAAPLSTVSGNVQIVNAPGGSVTSVVLTVESTFDEATARGQVPPGLRVGGVTGAFSIPDIPAGRYAVLAAFENDNLVRDPDENIAGTQVVHIEVPDPVMGQAITISEGFKITEALAVVSPGADGPEQVSSLTPTFVWADDSSEDGYTIRVFDAFGNLIWETEIGPVTGSATVSLAYAGPALEPGMFYQFRVTSFRERSGSRSAISTTEDLKGVFYFLKQ
jgi:hypothetical protein